MIIALPSSVRADASTLVVVLAQPFRGVTWSLDGPGTLDVISNFTDDAGRAYARFTPAAAGDVATVSAEYGT